MAYPRICDRRLYRELPTYKIYFLRVSLSHSFAPFTVNRLLYNVLL